MIDKISLSDVKSNNTPQKGYANGDKPVFRGFVDGVIRTTQMCEKQPMLNVTVLDLVTAIVPRTVIETCAGAKKKDENGNTKYEPNIFAGFEALRREGSGLLINCIIPSFVVMAAAKVLQKPIMGKDFNKSKLANVWANTDTLDKINHFLTNAEGKTKNEKVYNALKNMFSSLEGVDGNAEKGGLKQFKDIYPQFDDTIKKLADNICSENLDKKAVKNAYLDIVGKTHIAENIRFKGDKNYFASNLESLTMDGSKIINNILKENIDLNNSDSMAKAFKKYFSASKRLVNAKSIAGLGIIIPLAISAQPINRWITRKISGKKGAPIYNDFKDRKEDIELSKKEKNDLLRQKFISVGSMIGVAALSMLLDKPTFKNIFQFKGIFPTMDQARLISTATFASRMASSEDKNELREATFRDIATFSSFYFLGDYVAKGIASLIEKYKPDVKLINRMKNSPKDANIFKKFWNWAKHTSIKSTDELTDIRDKKFRTICQIGNIVFSLISLSSILLYARNKTNRKHKEEIVRQNTDNSKTSDTGIQNDKNENNYRAEYSHIKDNTAFKAFFNS